MTGMQARRCLSLALWAALLLAPSLPVAIGLAAAGTAAAAGPAAWRAVKRRRAQRQAPAAGAQVVLGRDAQGRPVGLGDSQLAAHTLIVGAAGSGKSTSLLTLLDQQIRLGQAVIAIDMKGAPSFAAQLRASAEAAGRGLRVWTPDGPGHWNPLAHGNATSLKDKLISSERFSEPHYQRAAERYIQTVLAVLHAARPDRPAQLDEVVALMEPIRLSGLLRGVPGPRAERVQDYLAALTGDQLSAIRGLGTRLALLSESCAGPYLHSGRSEETIDLRRAMDGGDVILFSLNSSVYGKLGAQLGSLVVQDLTNAAGTRLGELGAGALRQPATVAIDEFSALDNDNLLGLLARGREAGVPVFLATQELADLERAARGFRDQVTGIVGVKIIHRQDVPSSADLVARMAGTEPYWEETRQIRGLFAGGRGSRGTRRLAERAIVHPNEVMRLPVGHAIAIIKFPAAQVLRVVVTPPPRAPAGGTVGPQPTAGARPQPAAGPGPAPPPRGRAAPSAGREPGRSQSPGRPPSPRHPPNPRQLPGPPRPPGRDYPAPGVTR